MKAKADAFFASAGKLELEVYRIEQFEPILQATETYGKFYMGDSYVVLKKQRSAYEIHYWHGKEATTVSSKDCCCCSRFRLAYTYHLFVYRC